jgi:L-ornithine N5-oxygenase
MSSAEGVVLVIGCGRRLYREYLLSSAAARHPLWLFNASELTWQREHVRGGTVLDLDDRDAVLAAARELAAMTTVAGVMSWDEALIVTTAHVAHELGVPGAGLDGIEGCRDKPRSRRVLTAAGLAQPRFDFAGDEAQAVMAAERIGYPVVVKPRAGGASIGVVLAADAGAVRDAFHAAEAASLLGSPEYQGGALVEEYLAGPEISVDGAVVDGHYTPLFVARKTVGMHPYFEELGHVVNAADDLMSDPRLLVTLARAHRAIEFRYGVTHTEVKLTERGPMIVEINGRLGGDLIPLLAQFATGIDPAVVAVDVALGVHPEIRHAAEDRCVGVRFGYPRQDCVVESVSVPECRPDNGVLAAAALVEPGTRLRLPPAEFISRHAYVICEGRDPEECAALLGRALSEVRLTGHAVTSPASAWPVRQQRAERTMANRDVELLAVGAGPSNLALAVALEELAPGLARGSLVVDREQEISWQRSMLLPEVLSNTSFLKDLVTLRNPRSKFSFLSYLHAIGRLDQFVNMGSFVPYRIEVAGYLKWTAESLSLVDLQLGVECADISPIWTGGMLTGWETQVAGGGTIRSRYLVIGAGRDARIPEPLRSVKAERVIHSTEYLQRIGSLRKDLPYRVAIVGAGQSAAELFCAVQSDLPECRPSMVMRSIGLNYYETSKFNNELYFPSFVDQFHAARPEARRQMLAEMRHTNYAGLAPGTIESLYRQFYLDRLSGRSRLQMITLHDITAARDEGDEVVLELTDRCTGATRELRSDLVLLGTGYSPEMPWLVRRIADSIGLPEIKVTRDYRLVIDRPGPAACYLHGVNEATHGIADSLLSLLAFRANDILQDILTHRTAELDTAGAAQVPTPITAAG